MLAVLYALGAPYNAHSLNGFLAQGIEYGFTKWTIAIFLFLPLFYFFVTGRYLVFLLALAVASPVLLAMRMSGTAFFLALGVAVAKYKKMPVHWVRWAPWGILLLLVLYAASLNKFDRLPTYVIALDVVSRNPFGLGVGQYPVFIANNYTSLFLEYADWISEGFDELWNSGESQLAESLASLGLPGLVLIAEYVRLMYGQLGFFSRLTKEHQALTLTFAVMVWSIIAHDYSKLDFLFFYVVGAIVGITSGLPHSEAAKTMEKVA